MKQLINAYNEKHSSVLGVQAIDINDIDKYGIIVLSKTAPVEGRLAKLSDMVEKSKQTEALSQLAVLGRYVLTPKIFELLAQTPRAGNEIQLTDVIKRYDLGDKFGFIKTTINFDLERGELRDDLMSI